MATTAPGQLTAGQVTTVQVDASYSGVEIVNRDMTGEIWVTFDGTDPSPGAAGSYVVLGARSFPGRRGSVTVKLKSTAALKFTVEAA